MILLLDTTTVSDLMREDPSSVAALVRVPPTDRVVVCTIVRGEIRYGIERLPTGKRRADLEEKASRVFAALTCEPIPEVAADQYGRIKTAAEQKGLSLDENDLWIAATSLALGARLVSRDSDFGRVDGLMIDDWSR